MKGFQDVLVFFVVIAIVFTILGSLFQSMQCNKCFADLNTTQTERDILRTNNQILNQQLSECKTNLTSCEANLSQSKNETAACVQEVNRLLTKNNYIIITIFLSAIMSLVTILKQLQKLPESWKRRDWWWVILSIAIILFAALSFLT